MKPFDLEAAKRGEPICDNGGQPFYFVGIDKDGRVVYQHPRPGVWQVFVCDQDQMRMRPRKVVYYVNIYRTSSGALEFGTMLHKTQDAAVHAACPTNSGIELVHRPRARCAGTARVEWEE